MQLYVLHETFIPKINAYLETFWQGWNQHAVSHENNCTPLQLFTKGIAKLQSNGKISEDFYMSIGDDYDIDYDGPLPTCTNSINNTVVPHVEVALTEVDLQQLRQINVLCNLNNIGVDIFLEILNIIKQNHNTRL